MIIITIMGEVLIRVEEAEKLIRDAEMALEDGRYESCCISSCYAMFHVIWATVYKMGMRPKTLEDAVHLFCMSRDELRLTRDDCSRVYRAVDIKSEIDGGYLRRVTEDVARRTLEDAKYIYRKVKEFLISEEEK